MHRIDIPKHILETVKNLPYNKAPHMGVDASRYPAICLDQNSQYNSDHAIKDDMDWAWTKMFEPDGWVDVGLSFDKADPGYIIPKHKDHFQNYCDRFGHDRTDVKRRLVFLEDWQDGHYFQLEDTVYHHWSQGEWVEWDSEALHMGANIGSEPRYTLQITGVRDV